MRAASSLNNHTDQSLQGVSSNGSPYVLNYSPGRGGVSYLQSSQNHPSSYPSVSLDQSAGQSTSSTDDVSFTSNRCVSTIINTGSGVIIRAPHIPVYYLQQQQQQQIQQHQPQHIQHSVFFQQQQQQKYIQQQEQNGVQLESFSGELGRQLFDPHQETGHLRNSGDSRMPVVPSSCQFGPHQPPLQQITQRTQDNEAQQRPLQQETVLISQREVSSNAIDQGRNGTLEQAWAESNGNTNDAYEDKTSRQRNENLTCQFLSSSYNFSSGIKESSSGKSHQFTGKLKENFRDEVSSGEKSNFYTVAEGSSSSHNCLVCKAAITCVVPKSRRSVGNIVAQRESLSSDPTEAASSTKHCQSKQDDSVQGIALDQVRLSTSNSLSLSLLENVFRVQVSPSKTSRHLVDKENELTSSSSFDKKKTNIWPEEFNDCSNQKNDRSGSVSDKHQPTERATNSSNTRHDQHNCPVLGNVASSMGVVVCMTCWGVMERIDELEHELTWTKRVLFERHLNTTERGAPSALPQSVAIKSNIGSASAKMTNTRNKSTRRYSESVRKRTPVPPASVSDKVQTGSWLTKTPVSEEDAAVGDAIKEVPRAGPVKQDSGQQLTEEERHPDDPDFSQQQTRKKDNKPSLKNQSDINSMIEFIAKKKGCRARPEEGEAAPGRPPPEDRNCPRCAKLVPAGTFVKHLYRHKLAPCPFCHACHATTELKLHLLSAHRHHQSFACLECMASYSNYRHLRLHQLTQHVGLSPARPVSCRVCKNVFSSPSAARRHVQSVHLKSASHRCQHCDQTFNQKGNLVNHMRRVHWKDSSGTSKNCVCEVCDKRFEYPCDVREHLEKVHLNAKTKTSVCEICGKSFADSRSVKTHINAVHTKAMKYPCPYCKIIFHSQTNMTSHKRRMHEAQSRKFKCDVCMKGFCNPSSVKTHKKVVHEKLVRFTCDICQQGFKVQSQLKYHRRKHTGECPYQCPHCYKSFPGPSHIGNHVRKVHKTIYVGVNQRRKLNLTEAAPPPPPGILLSRECRPKASTSKADTDECDGGSNEINSSSCKYYQRNSDADKDTLKEIKDRNTETLHMAVPHHVVTLDQARPETQVNTLHVPQGDANSSICGHNPHTLEHIQQQNQNSVFVHPQQLQFNQQLSPPCNHDVMNQQLVLQSGPVSSSPLVAGPLAGVAIIEATYPTGQYEQVL